MRAENAQTDNSFKRVAENLYRTPNGRYYALLKRGGKQIKKSLKTEDRKLADRRLKEFIQKANRVNLASENRNIRFEELADHWLKSIESSLKPKSFLRQKVAINALQTYFKGVAVRSLIRPQIDTWKTQRGASVAARTWNLEFGALRCVARDRVHRTQGGRSRGV